MLGIALGVIHISLADFDALSPRDFNAVCKAYEDSTTAIIQATDRSNWHKIRFLVVWMLRLFRPKTTEKDVGLFPWEENKETKKRQRKASTKEEYERALKRFNSV